MVIEQKWLCASESVFFSLSQKERLHVHVHVHMYIYMCMYMYTCINTYAFTCVDMHIVHVHRCGGNIETQKGMECDALLFSCFFPCKFWGEVRDTLNGIF